VARKGIRGGAHGLGKAGYCSGLQPGRIDPAVMGWGQGQGQNRRGPSQLEGQELEARSGASGSGRRAWAGSR
jgi:hypothetical protein